MKKEEKKQINIQRRKENNLVLNRKYMNQALV